MPTPMVNVPPAEVTSAGVDRHIDLAAHVNSHAKRLHRRQPPTGNHPTGHLAAPHTLVLTLFLLAIAGCGHSRIGSLWVPANGLHWVRLPKTVVSVIDSIGSAHPSRHEAAMTFEQAEHMALHRDPACVDSFFAAARLAWEDAQASGCTSGGCRDCRAGCESLRLYHDSVGRMIHEGLRHHRLDPVSGLTIRCGPETMTIPVELEGFPWQPEDFNEWHQVGHYANSALAHYYRNTGVGVPLVIVRRGKCTDGRSAGLHGDELKTDDFLADGIAFGATAVLQPDGSALTLYNPLCRTEAMVGGNPQPLARDLTASIAYSLHYRESTALEDFLRPGKTPIDGRLYFQEPYQPGKIPLLFVHGLFSNRMTWANIYNELRSRPGFLEKYQVWAFQYSTGDPFVRSAAELRSELSRVADRFPAAADDPALRQTVLVGHSMGGLISRVLVSHSGDQVWDTVANIPLDMIATDEANRARLADRLYFEPHPFVKRVVMIATPHQGSDIAGKLCGRLASSLVVQTDPQMERVVCDNPGAFKRTLSNGLPTSIDLLDPTQPFLRTLSRLPTPPELPLHSIIGTGPYGIFLGQTDGVVSVHSATIPRVTSTRLVSATHSAILRHPHTVDELSRILTAHLHEHASSTCDVETTQPWTPEMPPNLKLDIHSQTILTPQDLSPRDASTAQERPAPERPTPERIDLPQPEPAADTPKENQPKTPEPVQPKASTPNAQTAPQKDQLDTLNVPQPTIPPNAELGLPTQPANEPPISPLNAPQKAPQKTPSLELPKLTDPLPNQPPSLSLPPTTTPEPVPSPGLQLPKLPTPLPTQPTLSPQSPSTSLPPTLELPRVPSTEGGPAPQLQTPANAEPPADASPAPPLTPTSLSPPANFPTASPLPAEVEYEILLLPAAEPDSVEADTAQPDTAQPAATETFTTEISAG